MLGRRLGPWSRCSWGLLAPPPRAALCPPCSSRPLPRWSLAVAPLCVPGSKPRCPRACLTSTPTLGIVMAAVPFSAEASPVCTVRAPGVSPAACSVPPGLRPPPVWPCAQAGPAAAAASETPQGLVLPRSLHSTQVGAPACRCAVTPVSRGGRQRHAWWPLPGRRPPETLLCVPARSFPGCPGSWAFLLVRAAGTGEGSRSLHLKVAF